MVDVVYQNASMKIRTTKISSEGLGGNFTKLYTSKNFLLYSILKVKWSNSHPIQSPMNFLPTPWISYYRRYDAKCWRFLGVTGDSIFGLHCVSTSSEQYELINTSHTQGLWICTHGCSHFRIQPSIVTALSASITPLLFNEKRRKNI